MRDVLTELLESWESGETAGVGTVVQAIRSAPRPPGASMMVAADSTVAGSVSGGCVEGAVYELSQEVVASGVPVLQRYGFSDDEAFAVGLTCGGIIDVFVEPVSQRTYPEFADVAADIEAGRPVAVATVIEHPDPAWLGRRLFVRDQSGGGAADAGTAVSGTAVSGTAVSGTAVSGTFGLARADNAVADDVRGLLAAGSTAILTYGPAGERMDTGMRVFVQSYQPKPRMIVFGAIDFASAVARQGSFLGYHVTVCDARPVFTTRARFPVADEVIVAWPHHYLQRQADEGRLDERTILCVLTHDPKFDVPVLKVALGLEGRVRPAYIGVMGSRITHEDRLVRLKEAGLTDDQLARMASPIGLDLGGRTPEETAVSVAAEIVALRWGGSAKRLSQIDSRVHGQHGIAADVDSAS